MTTRVAAVVSLMVSGLVFEIAGFEAAAKKDVTLTLQSSQASLDAGKQGFGAACRSCHGEDGVGRFGPPLRGPRFTAEYVARIVLEGWPGSMMPSFKDALDSDEVSQIAQYVQSVASLRSSTSGPTPASTTTRATSPQATSSKTPGGFYTEAQARHGKLLFLGYCYMCHSADRTEGPPDPASRRGMPFGTEKRLMSLTSDRFAQRWGRVFDLYNKVAKAMPADSDNKLNPEEAADIVAYLLQVNGLPAGKETLKADTGAMKNMDLAEPGFEKIFNGADFTGIRFIVGCYGFTRNPPGCAEGDTGPGAAFKVDSGTIRCSGRPQGYWYTENKYLNFTLRFEFRYERDPDLDSDEEDYGNSGYLLFIEDHVVWPASIEIQGRNREVLNVLSSLVPAGMRDAMKFTVDDDARKRVLKPMGQWNAVEIVSKEGRITSSLNGTLISTVMQHPFKEPGHIGFQSEGGKIQWRNIRIKQE